MPNDCVFAKSWRWGVVGSLLVTAGFCFPQLAAAEEPDRTSLWEKIEKYTRPPADFVGQFGSYRSPLNFADGSKVQTADDWARRRAQILETWHKRLGPWPPLVDQPQVTRLETIERDGFVEHRVQIQISTDGKLADGYLLIPRGAGPFPAVFVPFYEPLTSIGRGEKGKGTHDYGLQLVRRGFVTLSIGTPGALEKIGLDTRKSLVQAGIDQRRQPLTVLAYVAACCHAALARQPEVDAARIGIIGLSYGGKWSMFASCLFDKFACAVWSDPGIVFNEANANVNYWEPWYLGYDPATQRKPGVPSAENPRTGLYKELFEGGDDLVDLHALMAPRPVLVSGGTEDPPRNWRALNHLIAVNELLGKPQRVAMTARPSHVPTPEALALELAFLEYWLKANPARLKAAAEETDAAVPQVRTVHGRQMERLGRGLAGLRQADGSVFLSWRWLGTDPESVAFNIYRSTTAENATRLNPEPLTGPTYFVDRAAAPGQPASYAVRPVIDEREQSSSPAFALAGDSTARPYFSVPLQTPAGYSPNDASVGDLDGDGEYEIVLHQVGRGRDNSQAGTTTEPILEAYKLDGTLLWRINLGRNIREGAHYTQFMVYDLDGDGKAEIACKTADGTIDGAGRAIGDATADYRNARGYVLDGPEFLTIFDGLTGAALATTEYVPPRGNVASWGDNYGNRVDRFLACIAYLDGKRPSLVCCRGYYTRTVLAAWNWREGRLSRVWTFDSDDGTPGNQAYRGQGNHSLSVGDVDGDGKDEIVYGSCVIDDDGRGLYSTGFGHGDAMHLTDIDPDRPGLEVFKANGDGPNADGIQLRDAAGKSIWGVRSTGRGGVGRALALDIDPRHRGLEMWGKGEGVGGLYNVKGERFSDVAPRSCNMGIWWDGDLLRELLDGVTIRKWDFENARETPLFSAADFLCVSNNGSKSNPCLCADILGDWREELIVRTRDNRELRIFTTTIPTEHRLRTLMHDPVYRLGIAWQNVGYNQPAHPGFYLGAGMVSTSSPAGAAQIK
jgi:rhamnogalacturonan endolyase